MATLEPSGCGGGRGSAILQVSAMMMIRIRQRPIHRQVMIACAAICLFGLVAPVTTLRGWQQSDPQQIVDQFFPQSLIDQAEPPSEGSFGPVRRSAYAVLDQMVNGTPTRIVACYTNGDVGAIRVIERSSGGQYQVAFEPTTLDLAGGRCEAELPGQVIDGRPLIRISFGSTQGPTADWMLRWSGTALVSLGPTKTGPRGIESTLLSDAILLDLDHNGLLELVSETGSHSLGSEIQTDTCDVYRFSEGKYALWKKMLYLAPFGQPGSQPNTRTETFSLPSGAQGPYRMKVVNGERGGGYRTASGTIVLNGQTVVNSGQLNLQAEFVTVNVDLQAKENNMQVTLANRQGAQVWVYVEKVAAP